MKKFVKICILLVMALALTACQYENWGENSGPTVDIVERSDLLDIVNIDYVFDSKDMSMLADHGITASMGDFRLTGDYAGTFNLTLKNTDGSRTTLPVNCLLAYDKNTVNGKDAFSNVQLYWGRLKIFGDDIVITNMNIARVLSLDNAFMTKTAMDLSFLDEIGGYALNVAPVADGYVYSYYSNTDCGIAIYSDDGRMSRKITLADEGVTNSFATVKNIFNIETTPLIYTSGNGMIYLAGAEYSVGGKNAYLYDMTNDISYGRSRIFMNQDLVSDGIRYALQYFYNEATGDMIFTAAKSDSEKITDFMIFDEDPRIPSFAHYIDQSLKLDENGNLRFDCAGAGLSLTVDFEQGVVTKQFNITEDLLGEKLYTSQDKKYSLYEFAHFNYPNMSTANIALKEENTGEIKYIGLMDILSGEVSTPDTGFFSNGEVYLLTGSDFKIFDRDMENTRPVFRISDNFELGYNAVREGTDRYLCAVRRNADKSFYVVYYDYNWMDNDRYTEGNVMSELKATYQIALLDKDGNMISTHDTGVNVRCGSMPVNMYLSGSTLKCAVMYMDTDHALIKFDFNTNSKKIKLTQEFTQPEQW